MEKTFKKLQNLCAVVSKKCKTAQWEMFHQLIQKGEISERPLLMAADALVEEGMGKKACDLLVLGSEIMKQTPSVLEKAVFGLRQYGREGEARQFLKKRLKENPTDWPATRLLARMMFHQGKTDEYEHMIEVFLEHNPDHIDALIEQAKHDLVSSGLKAEKLLKRIVDIDPNNFYALSQLQQHYAQIGDFETSSKYLETIKTLYPKEALTKFCEGLFFDLKQDHKQAFQAYQNALEINPQFVEAYGKSGHMLLKMGHDLPEAWYRCEARFPQLVDRPEGEFWRGEDLGDKSLLIWAEQGIGDQLSYASMLRDLPDGIKELRLEVDKKLVSLFQRSFPNIKVYAKGQGRLDYYDYHTPIGAIARYTRLSLDDFTKTTPNFLKADEGRADVFKDWLSTLGAGKKIGICWRSGMDTRTRNQDAVDLFGPFKEVLQQSDVQFVNLFYREANETLDQVQADLGVTIHHPPELDQFMDVDGVASLISELDLVIGVAAAPVRLSQALGKETVVLYRGDAGVVDPLWWPGHSTYINRAYDEEHHDMERIIQIVNS